MLYLSYSLLRNNLFVFLKYYIPYCKINLLLNLEYIYNFFRNKENKMNNDENLDNNEISNINKKTYKYKKIKIIHKSVSIERMNDVNFDIDEGPIYI